MKNSKIKKMMAGVSSLCMMASVLPTATSVASYAAEESKIMGDADLDGNVTINDAVLIMSYVSNSGAIPLSSQALDNADVYYRGDGVSNMDALSVQKYLAQIISELPESNGNIPEPSTPAVTTTTTIPQPVVTTTTTIPDDPQTRITYIHLKNTSVDIDGNNAVADGTKVTISASGEYYIDGTLDDGQIIVNVPDETVDAETVKIFLNGVNITGASAPANLC